MPLKPDELISLADEILEAWKKHDVDALAVLHSAVPEEYSVCIVNPMNMHPTICIVRNENVEESIEGLQIRLDGGVLKKRTLVTYDEGK